MPHSSGSLLLGLDGVVVESVTVEQDQTRTVHIGTADEWIGVCPQCSTRSSRSRGWVVTWPRDIKIGPDRPRIVWRKRKWLCGSVLCERTSFTEAVPAIPPRARLTTRAKAEMALAVLDDKRSVAAVAVAYGCSWNSCHDAVIATADRADYCAAPNASPAPTRQRGPLRVGSAVTIVVIVLPLGDQRIQMRLQRRLKLRRIDFRQGDPPAGSARESGSDSGSGSGGGSSLTALRN